MTSDQAPPAIDDNTLITLREDVQDSFPELLQLFLTDTANWISSLRAAVAQDDSRALAECAHALKSSSGYFGANGLATLASDLEQLGRAGRASGAQPMVERLQWEFQVFEQHLEQLDLAPTR